MYIVWIQLSFKMELHNSILNDKHQPTPYYYQYPLAKVNKLGLVDGPETECFVFAKTMQTFYFFFLGFL